MEIMKENNDESSFAFFDRLPVDITRNILCRLPVKSVFRSRAVCKPWCFIVDEPKFSLLHICSLTENGNPSSSFISLSLRSKPDLLILEEKEEGEGHTLMSRINFDFPASGLHLVGSCNGLVCLLYLTGACCFVFICNPTTGQVLTLPDIIPLTSTSTREGEAILSTGFGFDPFAKEFKVVLIFGIRSEDEDKSLETEVQVFTLGSSSWRKINHDSNATFPCGNHLGVYVNGSVHWLVLRADRRFFTIVSFDMGSERFGVVPLPVDMGPESFKTFSLEMTDGLVRSSSHKSRLGVLGGCLCLTYFPNFNEQFEIWIMKDYNVKESWTKQFDIDTKFMRKTYGGGLLSLNQYVVVIYDEIHPICLTENGEVVFLYNSKFVLSYNCNSGIATQIGHGDDPTTEFEVFPYVRSLVSPKWTCLKEKNNLEETNV